MNRWWFLLSFSEPKTTELNAAKRNDREMTKNKRSVEDASKKKKNSEIKSIGPYSSPDALSWLWLSLSKDDKIAANACPPFFPSTSFVRDCFSFRLFFSFLRSLHLDPFVRRKKRYGKRSPKRKINQHDCETKNLGQRTDCTGDGRCERGLCRALTKYGTQFDLARIRHRCRYTSLALCRTVRMLRIVLWLCDDKQSIYYLFTSTELGREIERLTDNVHRIVGYDNYRQASENNNNKIIIFYESVEANGMQNKIRNNFFSSIIYRVWLWRYDYGALWWDFVVRITNANYRY